MYERLRRRPDIQYDPHIAHAGLIYDDTYAALRTEVTERMSKGTVSTYVYRVDFGDEL